MIVECPACHLRYDVTGRPPRTRARCRCGASFVLPDPSGETESLACPSCGAPCSPARARCDYCSATLASVRCPRCFAVAFLGSRFCRKCGASLAEPARALSESAESDRKCPRCGNTGKKSNLVANLAGDTLIDQCHECGGIWIDQDAFGRLTTEAQSRQSAISALGVIPRPVLDAPGDQPPVAYLRCPDCGKTMNRRNFARRSGVIIDVCRAHGIWFDHEELARVLQFVKSGGLEKAKQEEDEERREQERSARRARLTAEMRQGWTGRDLDDSGLFERPSIVIDLLRGISRLLE